MKRFERAKYRLEAYTILHYIKARLLDATMGRKMKHKHPAGIPPPTVRRPKPKLRSRGIVLVLVVVLENPNVLQSG